MQYKQMLFTKTTTSHRTWRRHVTWTKPAIRKCLMDSGFWQGFLLIIKNCVYVLSVQVTPVIMSSRITTAKLSPERIEKVQKLTTNFLKANNHPPKHTTHDTHHTDKHKPSKHADKQNTQTYISHTIQRLRHTCSKVLQHTHTHNKHPG